MPTRALSAAMILAVAAGSPALASDALFQLRAVSAVAAPAGLVALCTQVPHECADVGDAALQTVALDADRRRALEEVNQTVNRQVRPREDQQDLWRRPSLDGPMTGDCEDIALEKRRRLIDLGWPASSLRIAIAQSPMLGQHAVLVVSTDQGDLILDNLRARVTPIERVRYRWIATHQPGRLLDWSAAYLSRPGA